MKHPVLLRIINGFPQSFLAYNLILHETTDCFCILHNSSHIIRLFDANKKWVTDSLVKLYASTKLCQRNNVEFYFTFFEPCTVICICGKNQKNAQYCINDLIQSNCVRHVSNIHVFILRKTCTWSLSGIDQTAYRDALKSAIKLHVQIFLKMNIWIFETCRRHYN